ncbi:uncharacterized protein MONOS_534 [Monocercomonoides exilis]|uniref:uncharacterized protein n=1 Tax=Monocercomonoides exilis TaxID=2049356 RepID=UPI00355A3547|nr:hypothetical protein MONOS_534 [Monocercomonoides exilis]|eukprot:MONOS_534.1-p1 / transcript=MONOS_534.1 / gene=MONOS_534 / organism=Monocercomonoides_exilis_PA203 / gene_product=unspecified product / transcript_product=unspecified product / location=Mono_scaffold00008:205735-206916(-) / protein_length=394 / sequence_SO=supercontig / SO=protein_coding / is_pseudo=false
MHKTHKSRTHFRTPKRDSSNRSTAKSSQRRHSVGVTPLNLSSARRPSSPSTLSARRSFGDTQQNSQRNKSFLQSDGPKERSIRFSETFNGSSRNIQQAQNYASSPSSSSSISLSDHLLVSSHRSPQAKESPFTRASPVIHSPHTFLMPQMNSPKQDATIQRKVSIRSPSLAAAALQKDPVQSSSQSGTAFPSPSSFASSPHFPSPSTKSASESSLFAFSTSNSFLPQNEGAKSTPFTSFTSTPTAPSASFQSNRTQMPSSTVSFANTASTPSVNMQPSTPSISLVSSQFAARINEFSTFAKNYMQLQKPTNQTAKHSLSPLETPAPKQQIFNQSASLSSYPFSSSKPFNESNEAKSDNIITDLTENDGLAAQSFEMKTCKEKFEEKDEVELGD